MNLKIEELTNDIMKELNNDDDDSLNWNEFKFLMDRTKELQEKFKKMLEEINEEKK